MRIPFRRTLISLAVSVLVASAALLAGFLWLRQSLPQTEGEIALQGLSAPVEVLRDARGFVTIRADDQLDAAFALGFAHAQDRIWQMDFWRRTASGRLSEVIGASTLGIDKFMRTLGLADYAAWNLEALSPETRLYLEAYAAGVNAYLERREGPLPPAFLILGYEPEPWRPVDSVLWGRLMALQLSDNWRDELRRAAAEIRLGPEKAADLWPRDGAHEPQTFGALEEAPGAELPYLELARLAPAWLETGGASNVWALSGAKSDNGAPILANDPHLELSAPGIWYLVRIEAPDQLLVGVTAPGVPFVLLGHNGRLAWGFSTTHSDTQDLFIERLADDDPSRYLMPDGATELFEIREETIVIKDQEPLTLTVRQTRHGPVVSDLLEDQWESTDDRVLALAWSALRPDDRTPEALYRLNRAVDWRAFRAALEDFHSPQQNIFYADRLGTIAFTAPARVPIRRAGDGRRPVPGWTGEFDWTGMVPFDQLPQSVDPPSGRFVNANNRIVEDGYPHLITADWPNDFRARRIAERLDQDPRHSVAAAEALQLDTLSGGARALLPRLLEMAEPSETTTEALDLLTGWDYHMDHERPEPLVFYAWMAALNEVLIADELGPAWREFQRANPAVLDQILADAPHWCDDVTTPEVEEGCAEAVSRALEHAVAFATKRFEVAGVGSLRWGMAHKARFEHPVYSRMPFVSDFTSFAVEAPGGDTTVNRGGVRFASPEVLFENIHGAGLRAVYDLADLDRSRFMIATGQSGNPLSPYYGNMAGPWRDGVYITMGSEPGDGTDVLVLLPAER
jgi:penicillin amidase